MIEKLLKSWDILNKIESQTREQETELYNILSQNLRYYRITPINQLEPEEPEEPRELLTNAPGRPESMSFGQVIKSIFRILNSEREYISVNSQLELTFFEGLIFIEDRVKNKTITAEEYTELENYLIENTSLIEHELRDNFYLLNGKKISFHIEEQELV